MPSANEYNTRMKNLRAGKIYPHIEGYHIYYYWRDTLQRDWEKLSWDQKSVLRSYIHQYRPSEKCYVRP